MQPDGGLSLRTALTTPLQQDSSLHNSRGPWTPQCAEDALEEPQGASQAPATTHQNGLRAPSIPPTRVTRVLGPPPPRHPCLLGLERLSSLPQGRCPSPTALEGRHTDASSRKPSLTTRRRGPRPSLAWAAARHGPSQPCQFFRFLWHPQQQAWCRRTQTAEWGHRSCLPGVTQPSRASRGLGSLGIGTGNFKAASSDCQLWGAHACGPSPAAPSPTTHPWAFTVLSKGSAQHECAPGCWVSAGAHMAPSPLLVPRQSPAQPWSQAARTRKRC